MRGLGIVTLLSVVATAGAPEPAKAAPFATTKSSAAFVDCFAKSQDRRSVGWWFVPKIKGGIFSNLGAPLVSKPYFLIISDRGRTREIRLEDAPRGSPGFEGVNQCI